MNLKQTLSSRRLLFGGIAAALGFSSVAAPALVPTASAVPAEDSNTTGQITTQTIGTYSSCSAYFGLTKYSNSDLQSYAANVVNNSVSPTPVIGTDLVPVLTVTDALSNTVECVPELAWTDFTSWGTTYFNTLDTGKMTGLITYPGPGYYRIPATYGVTYTTTDSTSFTPVSTSVRFESNYMGKIISVDRTSVPAVANGVFDASQPVSADLTDEFFVAFFDAVESAGNASQRAYVEQYWTDYTNLVSCTESDPNYAATVATLNTLIPGVSISTCTSIYDATRAYYEASQFNAKISDSLITVSIADEPPPTTTTSTTTTTNAKATVLYPALFLALPFSLLEKQDLLRRKSLSCLFT
jgi:hypothetical protein